MEKSLEVVCLNRRGEILQHHKQYIEFVDELSKLDEMFLRQPMQKGKWSIIEVVGHLQLWDQFVVEKRLPFIFTAEEMPASPKVVDVNEVAAFRARNNSPHITFEHFVSTRMQLFNLLTNLPEEVWQHQICLNQKPITFYDYVKGLLEHDLHHKRVVEEFLGVVPN